MNYNKDGDGFMRNIVVTGGTRGIGFGLTRNFLEVGSSVTISGTSEKSVGEAIEKFKAINPSAKVQGIAGNVANLEDMEMLWELAEKNYGKVDIWINNAGIDQMKDMIWNIPQDKIHKVVDTNIYGVINGSLVAFRHMLGQGYGQIFNMEGYGSDGMMMPRMTLYGTTKSAVRYFTRSLAKEAASTNVKVGTLSPGMVVTDFLLKPLESNPDAEKNKSIYNILADTPETVTEFLSKEILKNQKNDSRIVWLTKGKVMKRFMLSPFNKRDFFKD